MEINSELYNMNLADYDNVLIVDGEGKTVFYDLADLHVLRELGQRPEDFLGKKVTAFYDDLNEANSTIMSVLKRGAPLCDVKQKMTTVKGYEIVSYNSTYPIIKNGTVIGAIEFSKRYFAKENIKSVKNYTEHKIYRQNNTIYTIEDMITANPAMQTVKRYIYKVAQTSSTVLLNGRTGTGKEIVAQAIHNLSDRYSKPFISLNCSAIPESLMESTLFGTTKGSFTDSSDKPGMFEQADGGTLFLDEISSLPMPLQAKLLKAIEEKAVTRIGGTKRIPLDVRIVSAVNEDPEQLLAEKRIREDLFYRLTVVQINLPDLSERKEDIDHLVDYFIKFYNDHMHTQIHQISADVLETFKQYHWPGNVRELRNAVETAYNHAESRTITLDDIPHKIKKNRGEKAQPDTSQNDMHTASLKEAVDAYEKDLIIQQLKAADGKATVAAKQLGISKQSLNYKMEKHQLK